MEVFDAFWLFAFGTLLLVTNLLLHLMIQSINKKPLGNQSIFDASMKDLFIVLSCYTLFICIMYIFTRFEVIRNIFVKHTTLLTLTCTSYYFAFASVCIYASFVCITRIICLNKMAFIDETVGELKVRQFSAASSLSIAFVFAIVLFIYGETNGGSFKTIISGEVNKSGKHILCQIKLLYYL
jgi:hypothetical protein